MEFESTDTSMGLSLQLPVKGEELRSRVHRKHTVNNG